ncbi:hypothetical protein JXM83_03330 [Candidatus Woesearchaeota archaeon]|nr:hypothetical protein [Candidatus Woesearchaeota archaeon]
MVEQNQDNNPLQKMMNSSHPNDPVADPSKAGGAKKNPAVLDSTIQRLFADLNNLTRRLRLLEERFVDQRKKVELIEENSLQGDKDLEIQNKAILEEMSDLKKSSFEMKEKMNIMVKELQGCAKLTDVKVLEKYIEMWEPIQYVTFESMDKNVTHLIDLKMNELNLKIQQENFIKTEIDKQLRELGLKKGEPEKSVEKTEKIKPVEDVKKEEKPDEVEEINDEVQAMFNKKNSINGLQSNEDSGTDDEETFEDKKSNLEEYLDK